MATEIGVVSWPNTGQVANSTARNIQPHRMAAIVARMPLRGSLPEIKWWFGPIDRPKNSEHRQFCVVIRELPFSHCGTEAPRVHSVIRSVKTQDDHRPSKISRPKVGENRCLRQSLSRSVWILNPNTG